MAHGMVPGWKDRSASDGRLHAIKYIYFMLC